MSETLRGCQGQGQGQGQGRGQALRPTRTCWTHHQWLCGSQVGAHCSQRALEVVSEQPPQRPHATFTLRPALLHAIAP